MKIIGIHPIDASEPVHLIEIDGVPDDIDWSTLTQSVEGQPPENWQVPWDERKVPDSDSWCFFFHYLDKSRPLSSAEGELVLPEESMLPAHLRFFRYETP